MLRVSKQRNGSDSGALLAGAGERRACEILSPTQQGKGKHFSLKQTD